MAEVYTVKKGDTLWDIARKYLGDPYKYKTLAKINNIPNPNFIVVGQKIYLSAPSSSSSSASNKPKATTTSKATVNIFGLQSNTDRTMYAAWTWSKSHTDSYQIMWYYDTGDGLWFIGNNSTTKDKQSTYNAPSNAKKVKFKVKPVSTKHTVNKKEVSYWTAAWSSEKSYSFSANPPSVPSTPSVEIDKFKLTAEVDNIEGTAKQIEFQIVKNDSSVFKTGKATIKTAHASYSCTVTAGGEYKVRCRGVKDKEYSDWSAYSANIGTIPAASGGFVEVKALSETSVYLDWENVSNCDSYEIEYTTNKSYFDSNPSGVQSVNVESVVGHAEITGLESGQEYFFRVRAVNDKGNSSWGPIASIIIGKAPSAPTTWSSLTTVITGDPLILYWVHNAEDGSSQTYAELELYINGVKETHTIENTKDEDEKDKTSSYTIDTSEYIEGTKIQWRVRTAGITKEYGEWSVQRTVDIYAPPTLELSVTNQNGDLIDELTSFPLYVYALAGPNTQAPIGYNLVVTANEIYETVDEVGNTKMVNKGEAVYSQYFDITDSLTVELSAGNIDLENNISYTVTCTVSMNSGLTAESSSDFTVSWTDMEFEPNAEITIDPETLSAHIGPYCEQYLIEYRLVNYDAETGLYTMTEEVIDEVEGILVEDAYITTAEGEETYTPVFVVTQEMVDDYYFCMVIGEPTLVEGVTLSVYRREFDGTFTEIATGLVNMKNTYVTDPHPALDYARYRIVAITDATGAVSFTDLPGYPVGEKAIIIQWDEDWSYFDTSEEDELEQPPWSGSLLRLPYNIDVSDKYAIDSKSIEYIGRKRPVVYYGTQLGETSTWNTEIVKSDEETLYSLRRLAIYTGDVYVREPSGTGYWANISISFSQKHLELTIPVTLEVTRVEGGI